MAMLYERVEFDSVGLTLVGNLYKPAGFDAARRYPAVVMTPPAHQIKEQTCAVYGAKLAAKGYVALAFDYNSKGESESYREGFRNDENMARKQEDLRNAISYLGTLDFVDGAKLYGLGICGGGTVMGGVVITDLRIKAFASVSALMASDMMFADADAFRAMITAANEARQRMYATGKPESIDLFGYDNPDYIKDTPGATGAQLEGFDYYGTARAGSAKFPRFSNKVLANIYDSAVFNLGEHYADKILQPYLGIVGEKADTAVCTKAFFDKLTSDKEMFVIPGATHVDLYDKDEFISPAIDKITEFFAPR